MGVGSGIAVADTAAVVAVSSRMGLLLLLPLLLPVSCLAAVGEVILNQRRERSFDDTQSMCKQFNRFGSVRIQRQNRDEFDVSLGLGWTM